MIRNIAHAGLVNIFLLAPAAAQTPAAPPARERVIEALMRAALEHGQAYSTLQDLVRAAPQRLSGSIGLTSAEEWAVRRMNESGFANVHTEVCTVPRWVRGKTAALDLAAPALAEGTHLPILALGGSVATPAGGLRAGLVRVTSFEELQALGARARGKIVLFDRPMDPTEPDPFVAYGQAVEQRSRGAVEAAKLGALAALVRSLTLRLDDLPHTGALRYEDGVERIPAAAISTAGAERLALLLRTHGELELKLQLDCHSEGEVEAHNVIGELPGREKPAEIVVVGGHLDAWDVGQGAHDDGAGCAEALEALRLIHAGGYAPRRTLRCVLWTNEENGLRGARAYKDAHAAELEQHVLVLESDRGGFTPRGFQTSARGAAWDELARIAKLLEPYGAGLLRAGGGGADTIPLEPARVNVMEFLPDPARYFDFHHCAHDTLDNVHPRELELSAGVIAGLVYCVAELEQPLARPPAESPR